MMLDDAGMKKAEVAFILDRMLRNATDAELLAEGDDGLHFSQRGSSKARSASP